MRCKNAWSVVSFLFVAIFFTACSGSVPDLKWTYSDAEVVGEKPQKTDKIELDVYVDATTSMEGFAVNGSSVYSQFLDQLEASALSAWRAADPKFYKFGETIKSIGRTEFLTAKTDAAFYHTPGIFKKTYIDSVVNRTNTGRLSVLITDLFQDEGDVNIMVERFKEKCFANGVAVGIVGVKSAFNGKVFDVRGIPVYPLQTEERPFYAIIFGNQYNMELLFEALKSKPFVRENQFLIFSNHIIKSYNAALSKARESTSVTNKKARTEVKNSFDFGMKPDAKEGKLNLTIDLNRNPHCADFSEKSIEVVAFKKSATDAKTVSKDSTATNDIGLENIQRSGNKVTATVNLKNEDGKGNYSYVVYLKLNPLNGLQAPEWVKSFSTESPVPGTPSAAKTYNFEKLCSTLLVANASVSPTCVSKFYINLFKR